MQGGGELSGYQLVRDRKRREIKTPIRFAHANLIAYAFSIGESLDQEEPATFKEACKSKEKDSWIGAMKEEMASLYKNNTWKLVSKQVGTKVIGCRWIFKRKQGIPSVEPARFKARIVTKGYSQVEGIDYNDIFSPVVKHSSI